METEAQPMAGEADAVAPPSAAPDDLAESLAAANKRADENHERYLYALAEFENAKKRMERTAAERLAAGKKALLSKFLPVIDNLERALSFELESAGLRGGLQATLRGFESVLQSESVTPIAVVGLPFDPRVAEAITTRETTDAVDGTVLEEVQRGYRLGEELLRPAQVIVAKNS
ncbi:MAG: nucleotide exchange factor GrpE [Vulcanimicrobiaceae bacterium]